MKQSKSTSKKTLAVINGSASTGSKLAKDGFKNALVITEIVTSHYGRVSTAILYTEDMSEFDATNVLEGWWKETKGNKFITWQSIDRFEESKIASNFGLTTSQEQSFFLDLLTMLDLKDFAKKAITTLLVKNDSSNEVAQVIKVAMKDLGIKPSSLI